MLEFFPGQKPNEQVKVMVRPFWLAMVWQIAAFVVLAILPIGILIALNAAGTPPFESAVGAITAVSLPAYYLILITWFFIVWLDFYLDVGIVTNERVVDIDQNGLFKRNIAELDTQMVQDVTSAKRGVLQTVFDFGDVIIQTAGERPNFEFTGIHHPELVVAKVRESIGGRDESPDTAPGKISQAAEKIGEVAEEIQQEEAKAHHQSPAPTPPPARPQQQPSPPPKPPEPPADQSNDLPREYER